MEKQESSGGFIHLRIIFLFALSVALMFVDVRSKLLSDARYYLETVLYPVLVFADSPHQLSHAVSSQFKSHSELIEENEKLSTENYIQRADIMRLKSLELENDAMRKLLNSPQRESSRRLFAEVIDVDSNPYLKRVVVNRGKKSEVYEGMPVVSDTGLVGQVISVNYASSRVLLLTDPSCLVPVVDTRSHLRAISTGSGSNDEILINNVPRSNDMRVGDLLVTSGLGGVYPEGYPVAEVTSIGYSEESPFAVVKAKPVVDLDRMRYVLMFWYRNADIEAQKEAEPKKPTDNKYMIRQAHIKALIESLSTPEFNSEEPEAPQETGEKAEGADDAPAEAAPQAEAGADAAAAAPNGEAASRKVTEGGADAAG